ncbi:MAG: class I SAM-dependent methyltransferase [bacterium]
MNTPTQDALRHTIKSGDVLITDAEIACLAHYARKASDAAEIGAGFGVMTGILLATLHRSAHRSAHLLSIDPFLPDSMNPNLHATQQQCANNALAIASWLRPDAMKDIVWALRATTSAQAAQDHVSTLDLIVIDGDHHYDAVLQDFQLWSPKLRTDGYILIHDSRRLADAPNGAYAQGWPGPTDFIERYIKTQQHDWWRVCDTAYSFTVIRRHSFHEEEPCD